MSSLKFSAVVITTVSVFVALMSMQLVAATSVEGAAHTNENHGKLTKSRFLLSNSMEGGSRKKLLSGTACPVFPCLAGQSCCPGFKVPPVTDHCAFLATDSLNCGTCKNICVLTTTTLTQCCSGKCVDTSTDPKNCGFCGHRCNSGSCILGLCGGYAR
jgi:hypothetical protein